MYRVNPKPQTRAARAGTKHKYTMAVVMAFAHALCLPYFDKSGPTSPSSSAMYQQDFFT